MVELPAAANEEFASRMLTGGADPVTRFRIESDVLHQITRLFYHVRRIAKVLAARSEG